MTDAIGHLDFPKPEAPSPPALPTEMTAPISRSEMQQAVHDQFVERAEQTYHDPVIQERDTLAVVNFALEHRNIRGVTEFAQWLQHVAAQANASGFRDGDRRHPDPPLSHIAAYLRTLEADARRGMQV
jgi:hypothetical protein